MVEIDKEQYKMLKRINKSKINATEMSEYELEICKFLMNQELLKSREFSHLDHATKLVCVERSLPEKLELTQSGKAQLYSYKASFHHWWIPVAISTLSAAVSLAAALWQILKELAPLILQAV
ncbi:hypothetical protein WGC32_11740 [Zongyangia sp. HA2173]|uniref:hypothetical protein n=1 Tax=Zongyangia sp. HA2173 TaxID=3133035 RepID=UPI003167749C